MKNKFVLFKSLNANIAIVIILLTPFLSSGQTIRFWKGTGTWTSANQWALTSGGTYNTLWVSNDIAVFDVATSTVTFVSTGVTGITANQNVTFTAAGTLTTNGTKIPISVASGMTLNLAGQSISTAAGTGIIKNGSGVLISSNGNAYPGGFTINAGTMVIGGVNALGSGGILTINGGALTASSSSARDLTGKYTGGINITNNFQFGDAVNVAAGTGGFTFTDLVSLGSGVARTITIGGAGTYALNGVISGVGSSLTIASTSTGSISLGASNSYNGGTTISGGTLVLGVTGGVLADAGAVNMNGGTLKTGATIGFSDAVGTLSLTESSTIALGTGIHALSFSSGAGTWTSGKTLTITGWTGPAGTTGTAGKIFVGSTSSGLTADQLAQISFTGFDGTAAILSTGQIVPAIAMYRSIATGNWNAPTTWECSADGINWKPAAYTPSYTSSTITIQNGHNVSVTAAVSIDEATINSGGQLTVNGGILTIADGTGVDLTVNGTLKLSANSIVNSGQIAINGAYEHGIGASGGTIPTATWGLNSICRLKYTVNSTSTPTGLSQIFGKLEIDCASQTSNLIITPTNVKTEFKVISGVVEIQSLVIDGNYYQTGGTVKDRAATGTTSANIKGSYTIEGGTFIITDANGSANAVTLTIDGACNLTSGTFIFANTSATSGIGFFVLKGITTIGSGITFSGYIPTTTGFYFNKATPGNTTLNISHPFSSGTIRNCFYYNTTNITSINENYFGTTAQTTVNGSFTTPASGYAAWPISSTLINNLTINNSAGVTLSTAKTVNGTLFMTQGALALGSFALSYGTTATLNYDGTTAQTIGSAEWPATFAKNVTITNNSIGGVTLNENKTYNIGGTTTVNGNLNLSTFNISGTGAFSLASGGTIASGFATDGFGNFGDNTKGSIRVSGLRSMSTSGNYILNGSGTYQNSGTNMPSTVNNLSIINSLGVTLSQNTTVNGALALTTGALTVNPLINLTVGGTTTLGNAQCLIIKSNSTSSGSFIDHGFSGSGTAIVERWVSNNGNQRWEYISSPITTASSALFTSSIHGLRYANEPTNTWVRIDNATPQTLTIFKGYTRSYQATNDGENTAVNFVGSLNTGSQSIGLTYTATAPGTNHGWNLVGNPYPSAIDWDAASGWTKSNIDGAIYFRKNGTACTYLKDAATGGASNIIPPMQAFWVRVSANSTLTCTDAVRVHVAIPAYKTTPENTLHLTVSTNGKSGLSDDTYIRFKDYATDVFDNSCDAFKMFAEDAAFPQIYTISGTDTLAINSLSALTSDRVIPLMFKSTAVGTFTLTAELVSSFANSGYYVFLKDKETGIIQNLSENPHYQFSTSTIKGNDRFEVQFKSNTTPLPIDLISFDAKCVNNQVVLNWSTASEINNDFFSIERSKDVLNWDLLEKIHGAGNSNHLINYSSKDVETTGGTSYYRLKQTDFDGKTVTYSPVTVTCADNSTQTSVSYFPNPFTSEVKVEVKNSTSKTAIVTIYDIFGTKVYTKILNIDSHADKSITLNLSDLATGVYGIEFRSATYSNISKIVKK